MAKKQVGIHFDKKRHPHQTKTDHGGTADVNHIAAQYLSGRLPYPETPPASFADVSFVDIAHYRNVLAACRSDFDILPADARDFFGHDVAEYAKFLDDNAEVIEEEGLRDTLYTSIYPETGEPAPTPSPPQDDAGEGESARSDAPADPST